MLAVSDSIDKVDKKFDTKFSGVDIPMTYMKLKLEKTIENVIKNMGRLKEGVEL